MEDHKTVLDALELCAITLNVMKDAKADYMNTVYTTIASLIVVIGWFLTSSEAREFIGNRKRTKWTIVTSVLFLWVFHYFNVWQISGRAWATQTSVRDTCHLVPSELFQIYTVMPSWPFWSMAFNGVLFATLVLLLIMLKPTPH